MKKLKLEFEYEFEFLLYGISCHAKDYRLCWWINECFSIDLIREKDHVVYLDKSKTKADFAKFYYYDESRRIGYSLLSNHSESGNLVGEHKEVDYFLIIDGVYDSLDPDEICGTLRAIDVVLMAFELNPSALKSKENLVFE